MTGSMLSGRDDARTNLEAPIAFFTGTVVVSLTGVP
jgi:hypothetical protein